MSSHTTPDRSQQHQAAQTGLALVAARALTALFPTLDIHDLQRTTPDFTAGVYAIVHRYGLASATLATHFYSDQRRAAGIPAGYRPRPAPPVSMPEVRDNVRWAVSGLYGAEPDVQAFQTNTTGLVEKLVQDAGRDTIIDNVNRDKHAKAWARVPESDPCFFCAMLATRGAVYKTAAVFKPADTRFVNHQDTPSSIKVHDHCRCHAEPVFNAYEPSAQIREWTALYHATAPGMGGMHAAQLRFRQAYEGRAPAEQPALV